RGLFRAGVRARAAVAKNPPLTTRASDPKRRYDPRALRTGRPPIAITERKLHDVELALHGLNPSGRVLRNPTPARLYTDALLRGDGRLADSGPIVSDTGRLTGL